MLFFMHFINSGLEENTYGTLPVDDLFLYYTHTHARVCAWDFQPQSSPSVSAHSVLCFYWSSRCCGEKNNRNFICHWLSPLTVVSDVFYTHSTHTHRRAAVLTNITHTLPSQCCYQDYNTVLDTSWNFIKFHTISVCVSVCFFCACVCFRVFVLGVSGFSHAKSCKSENTDHKPPTSVSNQQPHGEPTHTHTHRATGCNKNTDTLHTHKLYKQVHTHCKLHLWTNCAFKLTHIQGGHWKHTATEHTVQPDTRSSLMLLLWYLPLHHRLFISQPCCFECARIVFLACWE